MEKDFILSGKVITSMKRTSAHLKQLSRKALNGRYGTPMAGFLLLSVITVSLYMLSFALFSGYSISTMVMEQIFTIVISLIVSVFSAGLFKLHLNLCRNQPLGVGDIMFAFSHHPDRIIISAFLQSIPAFVVQIPVYMALLTYYQHPEQMSNLNLNLIMLLSTLAASLVDLFMKLLFFLSIPLLLDHPELGALDSLKESLKLMRGHRGRLFYIELSFLGMLVLSAFTCYIGLLWVVPYMTATQVFLYMDIMGELDHPVRQKHPEYETRRPDYNDIV